MIRSLTIDNFRGFDHFELHDLGRVNLIVGTNNSGKTSVLEAVDLVSANGDPSVISRIMTRRGEDLEFVGGVKSPIPRTSSWRLDVRRLFHSHQLQLGSWIRLCATVETGEMSFKAEVLPAAEQDDIQLDEVTNQGDFPSRAFRVYWGARPESGFRTGVLAEGSILEHRFLRSQRRVEAKPTTTKFIPAASLTAEEVSNLFDQVVLTPNEEVVIQSLQIIEPGIERLASLRSESGSGRVFRSDHRGGIVLRLKGVDDRLPIGTMGEGIWRLLGLALCLVRAENGILLIDEIDSGLHYSVMVKMWRLVTETAKRLNIQVFATSHGRDCYESLAAVSRESVTDNSEVTIQRIERGKKRSVAYTEQEIVIAAEHGMEVR